MITALLFDFSRVLLLPKDANYSGGLNALNQELSQAPQYNFSDHFVLNMPLIQYLNTIKDKIELYMFTTETIQNDPSVKPVIEQLFRRIFTAVDLGIPKTDPKAYVTIANALGKIPQEIMFIDDNEENIMTAKKALLSTIQFTTNESLMTDLAIKGIVR